MLDKSDEILRYASYGLALFLVVSFLFFPPLLLLNLPLVFFFAGLRYWLHSQHQNRSAQGDNRDEISL
jgi:hypothetical protein